MHRQTEVLRDGEKCKRLASVLVRSGFAQVDFLGFTQVCHKTTADVSLHLMLKISVLILFMADTPSPTPITVYCSS